MSREPENPLTEALRQEIATLRVRLAAAQQEIETVWKPNVDAYAEDRAEDEKTCLEYVAQRDAQQERAEAAEALAERLKAALPPLLSAVEDANQCFKVWGWPPGLKGHLVTWQKAIEAARAALQEGEGKP